MSSAPRTRKSLSAVVVSTLVAGLLTVAGVPQEATAQQAASGNAPFMNSWLVSGPFDTAVAEEIYGVERPAGGDWASVATATASSTWKTSAVAYPGGADAPQFVAAQAIDGDLATNWVSQMHDAAGAPSGWPAWDPAPTLSLTWSTPITVKQIDVFDRHHSAWPANTSDVQRVDYTLKDAAGTALSSGSITTIDPTGQTPGVATLSTAVDGVSKVELLIVHDGQKTAKNVGLGFKEVRVLDGLGDTTPSEQLITPKVGDELEDSRVWEYFDDRVWNRNYDDYQDLHGYFGVKKGVDTRNKYVYAASYVHSPTARDVQVRYGSSGSHRLFVNDQAIGTASTPAEAQKDMVAAAVHLNEGWNKILIQLKHTYTEDANANGVSVGQDANVYYLGFYARVSNTAGNTIGDLTYSVSGAGSTLAIDTRGLSATDVVFDDKPGRGLPTNVLPTGYQEWPYVWNTSNYATVYSIAASKFRFLAAGGTPGYTWTVDSGSLPAGLTLNADGTVDGFVTAAPGDYSFVVKVTDAASAAVTKSFSITVKDRPNRWFELGRVSALSHTITTYPWFVDPHYSVDLWAQRAKRQGHSLVSIEAMQQNYYWPSKFADPQHVRNQYAPKDTAGEVVDGLKPFEEAIKRYDMKFGLYYASNGGGLGFKSSDVFVQDVEDLILRYDPSYLYFDGPQGSMEGKNFDAMYSVVRNYGDDILINTNAWYNEYGDVDLRTNEAQHIYHHVGGSTLTKRTIAEPWKTIITKDNYNPYYGRRDDYRFVVKEMIMNAGRGAVDNNDQMPLMSRGPNWDTPEDISTRYPKAVQENIDVRENVAAWFSPAGKPERHEATTGTMPYYLMNELYPDDGQGNVLMFEEGKGPSWGYAMSRDNNIYLHIMEGPDGKLGLNGDSLTISPVADSVLSASWLNEDEPLPFTQTGNSVTIDLTGVTRDPIDTIVKLVTDDSERSFVLTDVLATGAQKTPSTLQIEAEGYMTYPALKTPFAAGAVTYTSANPGIASVSAGGLVTAVGSGDTTITVSATHEGVTKSDELDVRVSGGVVRVNDTMIEASLRVGDREAYGEFSSHASHDFRVEGRSQEGGPIALDAATVTMKAGVVDLDGGTKSQPVAIDESDIITFAGGRAIPKQVSTTTRVAVWGEVTLDGETVVTNRVFMDLLPYRNMAEGAAVTASGSAAGFVPEKTIDGKTIAGTRFDASKWSVSGTGASWIAYALTNPTEVRNVEVHFNSNSQNYFNTPKTMEIQTSPNGTNWTTVATVTPPAPSAGAYFGFSNRYPVEATARHIRLNFPQGGNSASIDLQEVKINGVEAPILHWRLDEASGTDVIDYSGNANTGTVAGSADRVIGKAGNALAMNGTDAKVTSSTLATAENDNITMSAWVKWDGTTSGNQMILYNGHTGSNGYGLMLHKGSGNKVTILVGGVAFVSSQVTLAVDEWTMIAAVRKSGVWRLYIDGDSIPVANSGAVTHTPSGLTRAGASQSNAEYFNGTLDEIKIYEFALTEDQILASSRVSTNVNIAPWSAVTSSTETTGAEGGNVADGVIGQPASGAWTADTADSAPSVALTWPEAMVTDKIALYDLPGTSGHVTSGRLTFDDGTAVDVTALPDNGTAKIVTFPRRAITSATFEVLDHTGTAGLSEVQVFEAAPDHATAAIVTASTETAGATADLVTDGSDPTVTGGAWRAAATDADPSLVLSWPIARKLDRVVLYDLPSADRVTAGTLRFSDGTTIVVPMLPDGGGQHVVAFAEKFVTSVSFEIDSHTGDAGLAELQAYDLPELAGSAIATGSSMFNANYPPAAAIDGIIGSSGTGEWAVLASDATKTIRLTWPSSQVVGSVTLYDRANGSDQVTSGTLTFGRAGSAEVTTVPVTALPNGGTAHTVAFAPRNATWVEFRIDTFVGLPGLSEIQIN